MKQVIKKFPRTKWADLAAYHLIDNKLCGDWEAQAKCPEKEAAIYLKYADEHPQSPKAPEALYKAAWRYSALIVIYTDRQSARRRPTTPARAPLSVAKKLIAQYPNDDRLVQPRRASGIHGAEQNPHIWEQCRVVAASTLKARPREVPVLRLPGLAVAEAI